MSLPKQWKQAFVELLKSPIITVENGLILNLEYRNEKNKLHRNSEISPASIVYYKNGNIHYEQYWVNGKKHKLGGPASIVYYKNGNIDYVSYFTNGEMYRLENFAYIEYRENGNISCEEYWVNGERK